MKTELFTTTDAVKIYRGDPYWSMAADGRIWYSGCAWSISGKDPELKYFSTYVAASDYVDKNFKPKTNDI